MHLTPQSISGQLTTLEEALGAKLFQRAGRQLELTETGRRTLSYADEIFTLGDELVDMLRDPPAQRALVFKVGVADVVPKSVAYRLVEPALRIDKPVRLVCREGPLDSLLAELAVHRLDMVIADRAMPASMSVRGYNHFLGESGLSVFAAPSLASTLTGEFPACLDNALFLLPGADVAIRPKLMQWFDAQRIRPRVFGEFDDSALLKAIGQAGKGPVSVTISPDPGPSRTATLRRFSGVSLWRLQGRSAGVSIFIPAARAARYSSSSTNSRAS